MMIIKIDGKEVSKNRIKEWECSRLVWSARFLKRKLGITRKIDSNKKLLKLKLEISEAKIRHVLRKTLAVSSFLTKIMVKLSKGKRKICTTEFVIKGCSAESLSVGFNDMMLINTAKNRKYCLAACPDHYLLKGCGDNVQEVIEVAASMPMPLQFFVTYGDESGIVTPKDNNYPFQAAGTARLKCGFVMGGVRHQMKDIKDGCAVRLTVEFPALLPNKNIREHQLHLACEFYYWLNKLITQNVKSKI